MYLFFVFLFCFYLFITMQKKLTEKIIIEMLVHVINSLRSFRLISDPVCKRSVTEGLYQTFYSFFFGGFIWLCWNVHLSKKQCWCNKDFAVCGLLLFKRKQTLLSLPKRACFLHLHSISFVKISHSRIVCNFRYKFINSSIPKELFFITFTIKSRFSVM